MKRLLRSDGFDVIVVGSGLAGLSAALTVAEFGYSPVILEKACEPGGLTRRAYGFFKVHLGSPWNAALTFKKKSGRLPPRKK